MEDDLTQLRMLWELAAGFDRAITTNTKLSQRFSLGAAGGVLALPALKFGIGMGIANRPLLDEAPTEAGQSGGDAAAPDSAVSVKRA
jgi:hypothetical protein